MKLVSLRCTQCGAQLPKQQQADVYQCSYCGSQFAAPRPASKAPTPAPTNPRPASAAATPEKRRVLPRLGSLLGLVGGLLPFVIGGALFYRSMAPMLKGTVSGVRLGSPLRALWDQVGGPPVAVSIAGREAVVGRMRLAEDQLYIVATESATARPLWKLGPLGSYSEGYRVVHFVVAGERVIATDAKAALHIYDLQSGQSLKTVPLRDRSTNLCLAAAGTVAVAVMDRHHLLLDVGSLALTEAPLPEDCEAQQRGFRGQKGRDDGPRVRKPAVRGFDISDAHAEGELAVAAAVKSPGTPIPYAIGFAPKTREVRWQQLLPSAQVEPLSAKASEYDALVSGRYLAIYGVGSDGWHLTALDARQGERLWDVAMRPLFSVDQIEGLVVTAQFVYVTRTSCLEIYDVTSGKLVGAVGNVTYR